MANTSKYYSFAQQILTPTALLGALEAWRQSSVKLNTFTKVYKLFYQFFKCQTLPIVVKTKMIKPIVTKLWAAGAPR